MKELLDKYIAGKDMGKPEILEGIYTPDAVVHFTVLVDTISFPEKIHGNKEIAKVLSADFNDTYDNVKTYYLSCPPGDSAGRSIQDQGWMVMMREKASGTLKFGSGYYSWFFESDERAGWRIKKHEITIGVMLDLPGYPLQLLQQCAAVIPYPWASRETAVEALQKEAAIAPLTIYLKGQR